MTMQLSSGLMEALVAEARRAHPDECCGLLLGQGDTVTGVLPAANVHPAPSTHFEIDPASLIAAYRVAREGGREVLGYYHSHPAGPPEPSLADRITAAPDDRVWAIVGREGGGWAVRLWRATPAGFVALPSETPTG